MGHFVSKKTKEKIKKKSVFQKGFIPWNKGKKWKEEDKIKMSETLKARGIEPKYKYKGRGEKSPRWKGGITPENEKIRKSIEYRLWREAVFLRDNWTCQKTKVKGGILHPHHIRNFASYPKLRLEVSNGITLSEKSHRAFHKKYGVKNTTIKQLNEFLKTN